MWDKLLRSLKRPKRGSELYYATHYHLVPLYVLGGILTVTVLILGCYVRFLWQNQQAGTFREFGSLIAQANENTFLPSSVNPTDKKQYIYPANIRFNTPDPYQTLRYAYDPGDSNDPHGANIGITTSQLLHVTAEPLQNIGPRDFRAANRLQQCSKLYVIRFEPGTTQYGGFSPFKDVKLKDGRTAYIHKNTNCLNQESDGGSAVANLESTLLTVESY